MSLVFPIRQTVVPVVGKAAPLLFPVRRIYCIGQNYESHAKEMGGLTNRANPFFFTKPTDSIVTDVANFASTSAAVSIPYPPMTESYHHEVELVVALGQRDDGVDSYANLPIEEVHRVVYGYAVGLDMTRRDLQAQARENGFPWDFAKGPDSSAVVSPIVKAADVKKCCPELFTSELHPDCQVVCKGPITLKVNGSLRQDGDMDCMVSNVAEIIAILSKYVALRPGDLVFTGTPSGVGPVRKGDVIDAGIPGVGSLTVTVE